MLKRAVRTRHHRKCPAPERTCSSPHSLQSCRQAPRQASIKLRLIVAKTHRALGPASRGGLGERRGVHSKKNGTVATCSVSVRTKSLTVRARVPTHPWRNAASYCRKSRKICMAVRAAGLLYRHRPDRRPMCPWRIKHSSQGTALDSLSGPRMPPVRRGHPPAAGAGRCTRAGGLA